MRYIIRNGAFEETSVLGRHNSSAYYFECPRFQARLKETYKASGLNLAYCCGGVQSAIEPIKEITQREGMDFEFTVECYGVPSTFREKSATSQIGGTIVNLDHVSPIHPGGDQILYQLQDVAIENQERENGQHPGCPVTTSTPDHSLPFWQLHPHAYNLHRCLRAPFDSESEAFAAFLSRQAMSKSVMMGMATRYAEVALAAPDDSKVVRIASELQSSTIRQQMQSGDSEGARKAAEYLEELLNHAPSSDEEAHRWSKSLDDFHQSFND